MITIISATNRQDSMTLRVAQKYESLFIAKAAPVQLISLENRVLWERNAHIIALEREYLIPSDKFVFIMPEYNGSYPGILKLLMDNSDIKNCWWGKKAMLTGVAAGRAGNLRGLDHFTNVLNYLRINVLYNKIPLSGIHKELDHEGHFVHEATRIAIDQQIEEFIRF